MVDLPSRPLGDIDPEFEKMALETREWTHGLSGTSTRKKLLLYLANDVCREHFGLAFRLHVQAALSQGVPFSDVLSVVRFIGPYAGYPAADALERLGVIGAHLGVDVQSAAEAAVHGTSEAPDQGSRPGEGLDTTDEWLASFIATWVGRHSPIRTKHWRACRVPEAVSGATSGSPSSQPHEPSRRTGK